jgi:hypothetical protein
VVEEKRDRTAIEIKAGGFWQARHIEGVLFLLYCRKNSERREHVNHLWCFGIGEAGET